jgi:hypothetical protein
MNPPRRRGHPPISMKVSWQSVRVGSGFAREEDGRLVFVDGRLAALLVCRSDDHQESALRGAWSIDAGFGPITGIQETFPSFDDAVNWILRRFKSWEYPMRRTHTSH